MPHTLCHVMSLCLSAHGVCSVQNGCSLPSLVRLLASSPVPRTGLGHLPDWCLSSRQAGGLLPSLCLRLTCSQALATLAVKRFREPKHERRPWRIWFLDTSKQAIGMLFIHFANVYLADLTEEDPCSLYLINFLLDATVGMLLIYMGVRAVSVLVEWQQWESLRFGEYEVFQKREWPGVVSITAAGRCPLGFHHIQLARLRASGTHAGQGLLQKLQNQMRSRMFLWRPDSPHSLDWGLCLPCSVTL
ncbi:store-operated calcium entry regulator STIMATE isoform X3 [Sagmatias obliquidens]|uniref:store-operated calcium entry regulator STIMATE isoform X3 n=1 Tax=Sagmatias obliquidens TaxID=3371155 RepID=UPI000F441912|nr:store-operated calcium entry regulator STIMATE isoform X3 [Lagenorhynchus obliquidens]